MIALLCVAAACGSSADGGREARRDTLVVYAAASLTGPLRPLLDTFARRTGAIVMEEHGASLELARRITELQRIPDVLALADQEIFPQLLMPGATSWYARFARNRMVVAYTLRSRYAGEMSSDSWRAIIQRGDVLLGRADPVMAPAGYRALLVYRLAETFYGEPGLAARLEARTPPRLLRGNAAELAGLLAAGELDYIIEYESLALAQGFRYVTLPPEIDLGDPRHADAYARASVRIARWRDSVTIVGAPILYGLTVPRAAPHPRAGERFVEFLLGDEGRSMLRRARVDALDRPDFVGDSVPASLRATPVP